MFFVAQFSAYVKILKLPLEEGQNIFVTGYARVWMGSCTLGIIFEYVPEDFFKWDLTG